MKLGMAIRYTYCFCLSLFAFAAFSVQCFSETRYVSDVMFVTLREGPGDGHKVITALRSDTPIEVIEETDDWIKARAGENEVGYMKKRYTTTNTPKPIIIERLETEIERLRSAREETGGDVAGSCGEIEKENEQLLARNGELEGKAVENDEEIARLSEKLRQLTSAHDILKNRLGNPAAADLVARLKKENADLKTKIENLGDKTADAARDGMIDRMFSDGKGWMIVGGAIFFCGWLAARLSRSARRKRYF